MITNQQTQKVVALNAPQRHLTFRSDLMQLKVSPNVKQTIKKLDIIIDPKMYVLESTDIPNNTFNLNLPRLQIYTYAHSRIWAKYFSRSGYDLEGLTCVQMLDEESLLEHINKRMQFMPYQYYYNGIFAANNKYFEACYKA